VGQQTGRLSRMEFSSALVQRAKEGDDAAVDAVLRGLEPIMRGYFTRRIGHRTEIDDLVQNSLIRVHRSISDLNNVSRLQAFAMKGALYELQDFYRGRYSARELLHEILEPFGPVTEPDRPEDRLDLDRALSSLTPLARRIIELRQLGFKYTEIAAEVDSSEAAVKMQVKRAFEKLRNLLGVLLLLLSQAW